MDRLSYLSPTLRRAICDPWVCTLKQDREPQKALLSRSCLGNTDRFAHESQYCHTHSKKIDGFHMSLAKPKRKGTQPVVGGLGSGNFPLGPPSNSTRQMTSCVTKQFPVNSIIAKCCCPCWGDIERLKAISRLIHATSFLRCPIRCPRVQPYRPLHVMLLADLDTAPAQCSRSASPHLLPESR